MDGEPVPGTFAAEDELFAMGRALRDGGGGVFELAGRYRRARPRGTDEGGRMDEPSSAETGQPVTFAMLQVPGAPDLWKEQMQASLEARENGAQLYPQVAGRPFGVLVGWQTCHPFMRKPSYQAIAELPIDQRIIELRKPDVRAAILAEDDVEGSGLLIEGLGGLTAGMLDQVFVLGDPPDYEPTPDRSIVGLAERNGVTANEAAYDAFCAEHGRALLMLPLYNYVEHNHDVIREQLTHPTAVSGLAVGGGPCGFMCVASVPSTMISQWTRDRSRGEQLPLEWVVKKQTPTPPPCSGLATGARSRSANAPT